MPNQMESLSTLLRLKSPQNMTGAPRMSRRALDVQSGDDWMEPSEEGQLLRAQNKEGVGTITSPRGNYISVRSRESLRDDEMAQRRQDLTAGSIAAAQEAEAKMAPERVKGEMSLRERLLANQGAERVAQIGADQRVTVAEANAASERRNADMLALIAAGGDRSVSISGVGSIGAPPRASTARTNPPVQQGLYDALTKAREGRSGIMAGLQRRAGLTPSADGAYEQALTNVLHRMGNIEDAQQVAAALSAYPGDLKSRMAAAQQDPNFEFDLSGLDPYTQEYLALKVK